MRDNQDDAELEISEVWTWLKFLAELNSVKPDNYGFAPKSWLSRAIKYTMLYRRFFSEFPTFSKFHKSNKLYALWFWSKWLDPGTAVHTAQVEQISSGSAKYFYVKLRFL